MVKGVGTSFVMPAEAGIRRSTAGRRGRPGHRIAHAHSGTQGGRRCLIGGQAAHFEKAEIRLEIRRPVTREKRRQRALMQFKKPEFQGRVRKALREAGRSELIGKGPQALVPPGNEEDWEDDNPRRAAGIGSGPGTFKRRGKRR